jgi:hypothetical protein
VRGRREQRLLHGILGRGEIAGASRERAENLRRELAQEILDTLRDFQR